jgi:hypothetical protein
MLADTYTMSDNYHQPVHGGTGPDSLPLGFADQVFYSDGAGNVATPPATRIYNPNPQPGTLNLYTRRAQWFDCSNPLNPGIGAITDYLHALPYPVDTKCGPEQFYQAVNVNPAFSPKGVGPATGNIVPPTLQRSIGDVLSANNISWKYYGGGFNASETSSPFAPSYCNICNVRVPGGLSGDGGGPHARRDGSLRRSEGGNLPAVSYVKPDGTMDGRPASSKWTLFGRSRENIVELAQSNPDLWGTPRSSSPRGGGYYTRVHPAGRFLRHRAAHSDDRRVELLEGREGEPRVQRAFVLREVRREELDARQDAQQPKPRQPAEPDAGRERLRAGQHAGDRRPVRPVQLRAQLTALVPASAKCRGSCTSRTLFSQGIRHPLSM